MSYFEYLLYLLTFLLRFPIYTIFPTPLATLFPFSDSPFTLLIVSLFAYLFYLLTFLLLFSYDFQD